tara:strand:+ start:630 stop:812 length:183 start_codon:yes stop_codon:yes gene_type:complete
MKAVMITTTIIMVPGRYSGVVPAVMDVPSISVHSNLRLLRTVPTGREGSRLRIRKKANIK